MFPLGRVVAVVGVRCVCWNDSCLFFAATLVLGISLLWSPPALFLASSLSLLPRLRVPDFSLQVTLGSWPTPFLVAPPMTATTTAPLVGVSAQARWSPPPVASSARPGVRSRATCPEVSSTGLTTYDSPAENGSGSTGSTDGLVDSAGPGDLSCNHQGECTKPGGAV